MSGEKFTKPDLDMVRLCAGDLYAALVAQEEAERKQDACSKEPCNSGSCCVGCAARFDDARALRRTALVKAKGEA